MDSNQPVNAQKNFMHDRGLLFSFLLPVVFLVIGLLLLFTSIDTKIFAILIGAMLIIIGAAWTIRYFAEKQYMNLSSYGFSIGVLAILLGVCTIIKADFIATSLVIFLDICIMLTAIIQLQNAIQLKCLKSVLWIPVLCVAGIFIVCSVLIALVPFEEQVLKTFTYITLAADGLVGFIIAFGMNRLRKKLANQTTDLVENG